jgi:integrase
MYRPAVPSRIPRSVPDEDFNEIFAALHSHRDRALVAFYVSTGARASELLSISTSGHVWRCRATLRECLLSSRL